MSQSPEQNGGNAAGDESTPPVPRRDFDPDVERLHRPIYREPRDPLEGREPVPWWLWVLVALAIFWGGWYLGRYGGPFDTTTHVAFGEADPFVEEQATQDVEEPAADPIAAGQDIYAQNCQSCHQEGGQGLAGTFPPVVGSEWVTGPPETVIRIVLHGLTGPIEVAGQTYDGQMPAWGDTLTDEEISGVITYIRQWDANDAGPVSPEQVVEVRNADAGRTTPWTAEELRQLEGQP